MSSAAHFHKFAKIGFNFSHSLSLLAGGGGYVVKAAAKLWTLLTAEAVGLDEEEALDEIPEDFEFFLEFGPSYDFALEAGRQPDKNSMDYNFGHVLKQAQRTVHTYTSSLSDCQVFRILIWLGQGSRKIQELET